MAESYSLAPNKSVILKNTSMRHGKGLMLSYTDELVLTNHNLICVEKKVHSEEQKLFLHIHLVK